MVGTDGIRALVREGKTPQMLNLIQTGRAHGMTTLEMALLDLVNTGKITLEDAMGKANRPDEVKRQALDKTVIKQDPASMSDMHATMGGSIRRKDSNGR